MTDEVHSREPAAPARGFAAGRRRIFLVLGTVFLLILAFIFVPPMLGMSKYRSRITRLISTSLGRPVALSSVEMRLLPRPGFVITNLSVAEDPAYGAEPVLHANTVTASIRLLSLLRGSLAIDSISLDEASLNVVRSGPGLWNLDPLFRTAAAKAGSIGSTQRARPLPYLEATNSRINIKNGAEKLPFSLVNTDFEFWQPDPGEWRIRLRGQPARTDVNLSLEDTGEVRLEASAHRAPALRMMPVHVDLDWREAQLGQLARLLTGSDPGWRGDLTGELHLDGTPDAAHVTTRLRAAGVHRAEFAPVEPLDFDANCAFVYHYSLRSLDGLDCNSPLGDGRIRLTGDLIPAAASASGPSNLTLALDRISVGAGLDLLRTVRSGLAPDLSVTGAISGKLVYSAATPTAAPSATPAPKSPRPSRQQRAGPAPPPQGPLTGSLTVDGFELSRKELSQPVRASKIVLEPVSGDAHAIAGSMSIPAGEPTPLSIDFRLALNGYQVVLRGPASLVRARELARAAGFSAAAGLDNLAGDQAVFDLSATGPWLPAAENPIASQAVAGAPPVAQGNNLTTDLVTNSVTDSLTGSVTIHNANWRADFLASPLQIAQATLHLGAGQIRWEPVAFSYGAVKGTASLDLPLDCPGPDPCLPQFQIQFGDLDTARLQTAILGVHEQDSEKGSLLSNLIDRLHPSSAPPWPRLQGTVKANSLLLGPVVLRQPSAAVQISPDGAEITNLSAGLLGGQLHFSVSLAKPANDQDKPSYALDGGFEKVSAAELGQLIGLRWSGGPISGSGNLKFAGYTGADVAASVKGSLHFECQRGAIAPPAAAHGAHPYSFPPELARFDHWSADALIANGAMTLSQSQTRPSRTGGAVQATLTFADPPRVSFGPAAGGSVAEPQPAKSKTEKP